MFVFGMCLGIGIGAMATIALGVIQNIVAMKETTKRLSQFDEDE